MTAYCERSNGFRERRQEEGIQTRSRQGGRQARGEGRRQAAAEKAAAAEKSAAKPKAAAKAAKKVALPAGPPCRVEGCKQPSRAKGYCRKHFMAWRRGSVGDHHRYKICTKEGCRKPRTKAGFCDEHAGIAAPAAAAAPAAPASEGGAPA